MANRKKFTEKAKQAYLDHLRRTGNGESSAAVAGVTTETVRVHREDEAFALAEKQAKQAFVDTLVQEAIRRARDGVLKPVFYKGERIDNDQVREYSDVLLIALLKRYDPDFRDRQTVDMNVTGGVLVIGAEKTAEEWASEYGGEKDQ